MECTQLVDLIFFMGQSNMAGRGDAALAPAVTPGMGYEYRAVTDPAQLHPLAEPFGVNENDPTGRPDKTEPTICFQNGYGP